jgi:hypothetical protein
LVPVDNDWLKLLITGVEFAEFKLLELLLPLFIDLYAG